MNFKNVERPERIIQFAVGDLFATHKLRCYKAQLHNPVGSFETNKQALAFASAIFFFISALV